MLELCKVIKPGNFYNKPGNKNILAGYNSHYFCVTGMLTYNLGSTKTFPC